MVGVPYPFGILFTASASLSPTSCLAKKIFIESLNTIVTTDKPYREIERTSSTWGIPDIDRSTGKVTYCSISKGEREGAEVMTCT